MSLSGWCDLDLLPAVAKHVVNTLLSEAGMFSRDRHVSSCYRFHLVRRGQRRQYILCCKPLRQNTPLPFQGQRWWLWAAAPSLGGVLSLLWHSPLTYISYLPNMKAIWEKIMFFALTKNLCNFVGTSTSLISYFLRRDFGNRWKAIKKIAKNSTSSTETFWVCSVKYWDWVSPWITDHSNLSPETEHPRVGSKPHCWPREAVRRGFLTNMLRFSLPCVQSAGLGWPIGQQLFKRWNRRHNASWLE